MISEFLRNIYSIYYVIFLFCARMYNDKAAIIRSMNKRNLKD